MRKYIAALAGIGLISGCASQRDVRFGDYSMTPKGFDRIGQFAYEAKEKLDYREMVHFCEKNDLDGDHLLSDEEVERGLVVPIVKPF